MDYFEHSMRDCNTFLACVRLRLKVLKPTLSEEMPVGLWVIFTPALDLPALLSTLVIDRSVVLNGFIICITPNGLNSISKVLRARFAGTRSPTKERGWRNSWRGSDKNIALRSGDVRARYYLQFIDDTHLAFIDRIKE
ncbi:hypothetical protein NVP1031O_017 [Vibrio phage 1.031.O._10N.261.46.F8]|nr:hypothetical protein NVP1031O_017 [Vibrio phage 1.031.O._10N.261.46.F8]